MPEFHFCCFPYISCLQKGLLKVQSGGQPSSTISEGTHSLSSLFCWASLVAVQSKHCLDTQRVQRWRWPWGCECLLCPGRGLLQGSTGHCWRGKQNTLVEASSLRKLISPAAAAADQLFGEGCIFLLSRCSWASSFYIVGHLFWQKMEHLTSWFTFILNWALS